MHLQLVLHFEVLTCIAIDVDFWIVPVELRAVLHQEAADDVGPVQSDLNIIGVVEGQVGQRGQD